MAPNFVVRVDDVDRAGTADPLSLISAARVTVVAGKGGVGKTTVTAVLARAAASAGRRTVVVELDGKPALPELVGDVPCLRVSAPAALEEYLRDHGFGRIARRLTSSGVIDVVSTAAPGIDDIVVLGRIKQLERSEEWDTVLVDGPAAGHAVTMLTSAAGLQNAVGGGPVRAQADDVLAMLQDPVRCQVTLVTLAETTPVNETIETAGALASKVGVHLSPLVVNAVDVGLGSAVGLGSTVSADWPKLLDLPSSNDQALNDLRRAAQFTNERREVQAAAIAQLRTALPLAQLHVSRISGSVDAAAVADLADQLMGSCT